MNQFKLENEIRKLSTQVAKRLKKRRMRLVLAESCTAGRVSSFLGEVPGISECFCGSSVVYRPKSKSAWLGISPDFFKNPGMVSEGMAVALCEGALKKTPEATIAISITGHLGPNAPKKMDGVIWMAVGIRNQKQKTSTWMSVGQRLDRESPNSAHMRRIRILRASASVLKLAIEALSKHSPFHQNVRYQRNR